MRLNNPQDFRRCFLKGRRIKNEAFVLHYVENNVPSARLGVNIAKKKIRKAVDRNKIKRIAREVFRKQKFEGIDIVLILKNEKIFEKTSYNVLINEIFNELIMK
jgi:ribonuclease P protein component